MLTVILSAQAIARHVHRKRLRDEALRLRVALGIVLTALRELYENDLAFLASDELALISGRSRINLLRTQLARVTSLEIREVEAVMSASVAAERVETDMAIYGKRIGGVAYTIFNGVESKPALVSALSEACTALLTAEDLLQPRGTRLPELGARATTDCAHVTDSSRARAQA